MGFVTSILKASDHFHRSFMILYLSGSVQGTGMLKQTMETFVFHEQQSYR